MVEQVARLDGQSQIVTLAGIGTAAQPAEETAGTAARTSTETTARSAATRTTASAASPAAEVAAIVARPVRALARSAKTKRFRDAEVEADAAGLRPKLRGRIASPGVGLGLR